MKVTTCPPPPPPPRFVIPALLSVEKANASSNRTTVYRTTGIS